MQVEAERKKRAAILESEGVKEAEINVAEGRKKSRILTSEAEKQEQVNRAEGEASAIRARALAKAEALMLIAERLRGNVTSIFSLCILSSWTAKILILPLLILPASTAWYGRRGLVHRRTIRGCV